MSTEEPDFDFDDFEEEPDDPTELASAREELEKRCKAANIPFEERLRFDNEKYLSIGMPCGREKQWVSLFDLKDIKGFLSINFEKYVFLGDYVAICSYQDNSIEATLRSVSRFSIQSIFRKLQGKESEKDENTILELNHPAEDKNLKISLGRASDDLIVLSNIRTRYSLRIDGIQINQHDRALDWLERVSNSFFFQLDLKLNVPVGLVHQRHPRTFIGRRPQMDSVTDLKFPQNEFDKAPLELYWYGRSAVGMPLLQFLAFYQCIEYYFPVYSQAEARKKIKNILKDPRFTANKDSDVGKILTAVRLGGSYGFGDERAQLKATIQECIDPDQLRTYLTDTDEKKSFFSTKTKGLTDTKLSINNPSMDLRNEVAERIYDIRCKIVHTKSGSSDSEIELLLPFSKESELMYFDIDLVQYVSQQVLIAASSSLEI